MLYLIYGTDTDRAREKSHALFDALKAKKPDASSGIVRAEDMTPERIEEMTQTQGLFENKQIILMDRTLETPEVRDIVVDRLDGFKESPNIFIFCEGKLTKEVLKKIEKRAEKVTEYALAEAGEGGGASSKKDNGFFALADALGSRDKKSFWVLIRRALEDDAAPEELHGILFWQAKNMALAARTASASEAGLNPFVYGKAKRFAANFKEGEVDGLISKLVNMYHEAHRGTVDFSVELEKLALDI